MDLLPVPILEKIACNLVAKSQTWRLGFQSIVNMCLVCRHFRNALSRSETAWGTELTFYFPEAFKTFDDLDIDDFKAMARILANGRYMTSPVARHLVSYENTPEEFRILKIRGKDVIVYDANDVVRALIDGGMRPSETVLMASWKHTMYMLERHSAQYRLQKLLTSVERHMERLGIACDELRETCLKLALAHPARTYVPMMHRMAYAWGILESYGFDPEKNIQKMALYGVSTKETIEDLLYSARATKMAGTAGAEDDAFFETKMKQIPWRVYEDGLLKEW